MAKCWMNGSDQPTWEVLTSLAACTALAASGFASSSSATEAKPKLLAVVARMPVGARPAFCHSQSDHCQSGHHTLGTVVGLRAHSEVKRQGKMVRGPVAREVAHAWCQLWLFCPWSGVKTMLAVSPCMVAGMACAQHAQLSIISHVHTRFINVVHHVLDDVLVEHCLFVCIG